MATDLKTRNIQLNLNFFWESENININPSGWVLRKSLLNGVECNIESDVDNVKLQYINTKTEQIIEKEWKIPTFFKTVFQLGSYPETTDTLHLFSLKYEPEKFQGIYSQYLDTNSEQAYNKINFGEITTCEKNSIVNLFQENTLKNLLDKQFTYKPFYIKNEGLYSDSEFYFKYSDYASNEMNLKINSSNISDQLMVQMLKTSILKNIIIKDLPLKEQIFSEESYICKNGLIWEYEIAPIMPYGVLDSLKVSGEINLLNIGIFEQKLNKFKYYNTEFQSQLLLDMTSYNSQGHTVDTITLTFYDIFGKVCTFQIPKMVSYNGQIKVTLPLDGNIHEGMKANTEYPNYFSEKNDLHLQEENEKLIRLENFDLAQPNNNYIEELTFKKVKDPSSETLKYAYHDNSLAEGLQANYLYWVTVSYTLEENPEEVTFEKGYWYWTNTKYNEYYYNNDYDDYNDIPFDLDLIVNASISGTAPENSTEDQQIDKDLSVVYKEKNKEGLPFIVTILPDFANYYQTLRVNTTDVSTFLDSISYGIDSDKQMWDRSFATLNVNDEPYDQEEYSYVKWNLSSKFPVVSETLQYYPSFGNTDLLLDLDCKKITNLNTEYSNLQLNLTEDIQRTFIFQKIYGSKRVSYHPVKNFQIQHKYIANAAWLRDPTNMPAVSLFVRNSPSEINQLESQLQAHNWDVYQVTETARTNSSNKSVFYLNTDGTSTHFYGSWFIQKGGTTLPYSKIFGTNQLGIFTAYGRIGDIMKPDLWSTDTEGWKYSGQRADFTWSQWGQAHPYMWKKEHAYSGRTAGMGQLGNPKTYLCYNYKNTLLVFKNQEDFPDYLKEGIKIYGIDESESYTGVANVPIEMRQNEGAIANKQDLIIQVSGKKNPNIYLGLYNTSLWKSIQGCDKDAKCLQFQFNGPAQTVQNLTAKIPYPKRFLDETEYYKDDETNDIIDYTGYTVFYKKDGISIPLDIASYDKTNGFKFSNLLNEDNSYMQNQGDVFMYFIMQRQGDRKQLGTKDVWGNAMSGMFVVPFKNLTKYE